jgi:hypothetical protein
MMCKSTQLRSAKALDLTKDTQIKDFEAKVDALEDYRRKITEEQDHNRVEVTMVKEKARQIAHQLEQEANLKIAEAVHRTKVAEEERNRTLEMIADTKKREMDMKKKMEAMRDTVSV